MAFFNKLIKSMSKEVGKKIDNDIKSQQPRFTYRDKIDDLEKDEGLSPSYIKNLISLSYNKDDLMKIRKYLLDKKKTYNLSEDRRKQFINYIYFKSKAIERRHK